MIINDLDDYYIVFDTKNRNTELDTLLYNPCTAYCALSASDNSRVGVTTLLYVTYWLCITNQYNHYKNNFAHLLINSLQK